MTRYTERPKLLTVAEIDTLSTVLHESALPNGGYTTQGIPVPEDLLSLLRMARATAVIHERSWLVAPMASADDKVICWYADPGRGPAVSGPSPVEAIESAVAHAAGEE